MSTRSSCHLLSQVQQEHCCPHSALPDLLMPNNSPIHAALIPNSIPTRPVNTRLTHGQQGAGGEEEAGAQHRRHLSPGGRPRQVGGPGAEAGWGAIGWVLGEQGRCWSARQKAGRPRRSLQATSHSHMPQQPNSTANSNQHLPASHPASRPLVPCSLHISAAQHVCQQEGQGDPVGEGGGQARACHAPPRAKHKGHQQAQVQDVGEDAGGKRCPAREQWSEAWR